MYIAATSAHYWTTSIPGCGLTPTDGVQTGGLASTLQDPSYQSTRPRGRTQPSAKTVCFLAQRASHKHNRCLPTERNCTQQWRLPSSHPRDHNNSISWQTETRLLDTNAGQGSMSRLWPTRFWMTWWDTPDPGQYGNLEGDPHHTTWWNWLNIYIRPSRMAEVCSCSLLTTAKPSTNLSRYHHHYAKADQIGSAERVAALGDKLPV